MRSTENSNYMCVLSYSCQRVHPDMFISDRRLQIINSSSAHSYLVSFYSKSTFQVFAAFCNLYPLADVILCYRCFTSFNLDRIANSNVMLLLLHFVSFTPSTSILFEFLDQLTQQQCFPFLLSNNNNDYKHFEAIKYLFSNSYQLCCLLYL